MKGVVYMTRTGKFNWVALLVGIILIVISIFVLRNPAATILTLTILFGIIAIIRGIMLIVAYYRFKELTSFKLVIGLIIGILLVAIGIVFLAWQDLAARVFAYLVAIGFIVEAINNLLNSDLVRPAGKGIYALCIISSILLLAGGIILILNPLIIGLSISLLIGLSLMLSGIDHIIFAFSKPRLIGY